MDEMKNRNSFAEQAESIDLVQIANVLLRKLWIIIISGVLAAALFFGYTNFMVTPMYSSSVLLYVNNSSISVGNGGVNISASGLSVARSLVDTYIGILEARSTLEKVAEKAATGHSYGQLLSMVSAQPYGETEMFKITVTADNPRQAAKIANTIADVLPDRVSEIIDGSSVRVVDRAVVSNNKISPNVTRNTALGFLIGVAIACAIIIILHFLDDTIYDEDYLLSHYDIPVLAKIPNLLTDEKNYYGYKYYSAPAQRK